MNKIKEIEKSAVLPSFFQLQLVFSSLYFVKRSFPLNMSWKDGCFDAHIDIFKKIHLYLLLEIDSSQNCEKYFPLECPSPVTSFFPEKLIISDYSFTRTNQAHFLGNSYQGRSTIRYTGAYTRS